MRTHILVTVIFGSFLSAGCNPNTASISEIEPAYPAAATSSFEDRIRFADDVESNRDDDGALRDLEFVDTNGKSVRLEQYQGRQNVLLVFMRGFNGQLCPFCTTQTSRLIINYDEIAKRETEVLLVYPGSRTQLPEFQRASTKGAVNESFPFPVLLDEDLTAVKRLGIAADLADPSTFIIDKNGNLQLSYVGSNPMDRPSIKAIFAKLDALAE